MFATPITITTGNPNNQGTDNVLFNNSSLLHDGLLVQGDFNGGGAGFIIDFTSTSNSKNLHSDGGQAIVEGGTGNDPFKSLTFGLEAGATFTKAILNPIVNADGNLNFLVNYIDASGSPYSTTLSVDSAGNNFFGVFAEEGAKITTITISTTDTTIDLVKQIRLGGFASANVPDGGATVMLMGLGIAGLGLVRRKR